MKLILIFIIIIGAIACNSIPQNNESRVVNGVHYRDYTGYTVAHINSLKSPVILIGKDESLGCYSITVRDSNNVVATYGNLSTLAKGIGASREIGDTIR